MPDPSHPASAPASRFLAAAWRALGGDEAWLGRIEYCGEGDLPSVFAVSDLAAAAIGAAALAVAERAALVASRPPQVVVDRRLASLWFGFSIRPQGGKPPPVWDPIAGDYPTVDGWIRLHTNAARHRQAALAVLGCAGERNAVAQAVKGWRAYELEAAVVAKGGCAAAMRALAAWFDHPQGRAVAAEPVLQDGRPQLPIGTVGCQRRQRHSQIARWHHVQFAAQPAGRAAVIGDGHDGGDMGGQPAGRGQRCI